MKKGPMDMSIYDGIHFILLKDDALEDFCTWAFGVEPKNGYMSHALVLWNDLHPECPIESTEGVGNSVRKMIKHWYENKDKP